MMQYSSNKNATDYRNSELGKWVREREWGGKKAEHGNSRETAGGSEVTRKAGPMRGKEGRVVKNQKGKSQRGQAFRE